VIEDLEVDQSFDSIARRELSQVVSVLKDPTFKISGDTDVQTT